MGRLWTYHLVYDNVMLVFLLLAVINLTFKKPSKLNILILTLLSLTLLSPSGITDLPFVQIIQIITWTGIFLYLLICQKQFKELVISDSQLHSAT